MPHSFVDIVKIFLGIVNPLIIFMAGLSLLVFFKGLASFIAKAGDAKSHAEGRNLMVWGLIALFVMVGFLGLISLARKDFGFNGGTVIPTLPQ